MQRRVGTGISSVRCDDAPPQAGDRRALSCDRADQTFDTVQIQTAMAELSLLTEEFPDEAGSSMLWTLRIKLEKELEAITQRHAHSRLPQQEVPTRANGAVPHHNSVAAAPPRFDGTGHIAEPPDGPPARQAQGQEEPGAGLPDQETPELDSSAKVPHDAPCRHFRGELCSCLPVRLFRHSCVSSCVGSSACCAWNCSVLPAMTASCRY